MPNRKAQAYQATSYANQNFFYAECAASDALGACVYAYDTNAYVTTADASSPEPVVGVIIAKSSPTQCTVQTYGQSIRDFEGLVPNKRYFLGIKGDLCTTPFDDDYPEFVQQVGNAISATKLFIQPVGQAIRRVTSSDFLLDVGAGAPVSSSRYPGTDLYVDRLSLQAYLSPTPQGEDSVIYAGDGPPTDDLGVPQLMYVDPQGSNVYFADATDNKSVSGIIAGQGAPPSNAKVVSRVWYVDNEGTALYPRASGQSTL